MDKDIAEAIALVIFIIFCTIMAIRGFAKMGQKKEEAAAKPRFCCAKCECEVFEYKGQWECSNCGPLDELIFNGKLTKTSRLKYCRACREAQIFKYITKDDEYCKYCSVCLDPLEIVRNGKRVPPEEIAAGRIIPTEAEIVSAKKRYKSKVSSGGNLMMIGVHEAIRNVEKEKRKEAENAKLRADVAALRADAEKKPNIPWFAVGAFGSDFLRKIGLGK